MKRQPKKPPFHAVVLQFLATSALHLCERNKPHCHNRLERFCAFWGVILPARKSSPDEFFHLLRPWTRLQLI